MATPFYFDEILLDPLLFQQGFASGGPEYANANLRSPQTGVTSVAVIRHDAPLVLQCNFDDVKFQLGQSRSEGMAYLLNMWYGGLGSAYGFRVSNKFDYYTQGEVLALGDNATTDFLLAKKYQRPGTTTHPYFRRIIKPVVNTIVGGPNPVALSADSVTLYEPDGATPRVIDIPFKVFLNSVLQTSGYTISNTTGTLHFTVAPGVGVEVKVDFQFDTPMQFLTNNLNLKWDFPGQASNIPLVEILPATLGIT